MDFLRIRYHRYLQTNHTKYLPKVILFGIFALLITSCSGQTPDTLPTLVNFPTETATSAAQATEAVDATNEALRATETVEAAGLTTQQVEFSELVTQEVGSGFVTQQVEPGDAATPDAAATTELFIPAEDVRYQSEDGNLFVVVTSINTAETIPDLPEAPVGEKFVLLSTTLANFTGTPIIVDPSSLILIDQNLNRYPAYHPEDYLIRPLLGAELPGTTTMLGTVRFSIPEDAKPYLLEWCPYNDCEVEALQTLLP